MSGWTILLSVIAMVFGAQVGAQQSPCEVKPDTGTASVHHEPPDSALAHLSLATLYEVSAFAQDTASARQVGNIPATGRFRTNRAIVSGLVRSPFSWRYLIAVEFNGFAQSPTSPFVVNDLAIMVPFGKKTELSIGRQKEGVTEQMMASLRAISMTERPAPLTAFLPTRNDGVRLILGDARHVRWTVGWFNGGIAPGGPVPDGANELATRAFIAPIDTAQGSRLVQIGATFRLSGAADGKLRFDSRPETNSSPKFVDTKSFDSRGAAIYGADALVQRGNVSFTTEGMLTRAAHTDSASLTFGGFYAEAAWRPGGETREYDDKNGDFGRVRLRENHSAIEIAGRFSHTDLSDRNIDGGVFNRASAAIVWITSNSLRFDLEYGYSVLDRAGSNGHAQFLTARVQWELR